MKTCANITGVVLGIAFAVNAQSGGLTIEVSNVVSPQNPIVTLNIYGVYSQFPLIYGIGEVRYDLLSPEPLFGEVTHQYWNGWGFPPPDPINHGTWMEELIAAQLGASPLPVPSPTLLHSVEWSTTDFSPRTIDVTTDISLFSVYLNAHIWNVTHILNPTNGYATIQIIPAPTTSLAFLGAAGVIGMRRRR